MLHDSLSDARIQSRLQLTSTTFPIHILAYWVVIRVDLVTTHRSSAQQGRIGSPSVRSRIQRCRGLCSRKCAQAFFFLCAFFIFIPVGMAKKRIRRPQMQIHYLRLYQIIGHKKRGIAPLLPVSASTWWAGVKSGKFPQPIKLGQRITVWRSDEIDALLRDLSEVRP